MKQPLPTSSFGKWFTLALLCFIAGQAWAQRKSIIVDTDLFSDVDDVGALAVANVADSCGVADLKGVAVSTKSRYGVLAANVGIGRVT